MSTDYRGALIDACEIIQGFLLEDFKYLGADDEIDEAIGFLGDMHAVLGRDLKLETKIAMEIGARRKFPTLRAGAAHDVPTLEAIERGENGSGLIRIGDQLVSPDQLADIARRLIENSRQT